LPTGIHAGAFMAIGAFGQYIYVHPTAAGGRCHPERGGVSMMTAIAATETFALLRATVLALRPDPTS